MTSARRRCVVLHEKVWIGREVCENSTIYTVYDDSRPTTADLCAVGVAERFEVKVGQHQGSALSPCLFAMVMDRMTDEHCDINREQGQE